MRGVFLGAVIFGLLAGGIVAGVRIALDAGGSDGNAITAGSTTTATAEPGSPAATAQDWAAAWSAQDIDALYRLLTPETQQTVPLATFRETYDTFATELTLDSLAASVVSNAPGTAELDVVASTGYFGDIEYTTTLNLERGADRWLVAWVPATVHPEFVSGRRIVSTIERPTRGAILDRNGAPLAITADTRMLGLNRSIVADRVTLTATLVAFGFPQADVDAAFDAPGAANQRVGVGPIPDELAEAAVTQLRPIDGVLIYFESRRTHPLGESGAHVVGYTRELTAEELADRHGTGARIGDRIGAVGLEAVLESRLAGQIGAVLKVVDGVGNDVKTLVAQEYIPGEDVTTALDANTLIAAQQRLAGRKGSAVVINPGTNEILAMVSSPSFDPDAFERNDGAALAAITSNPDGPLANRATEGLYSAGSTFKLFTGSAAFVYGGFSTSDTIYCGATWDGVDPPRANWEGAQGPLTIAQGLMRSCNPVFYEIGLRLYDTDNDLSKMARQYGFGAVTGVQGIYEEAGLVPDAEWKSRTRNEPWYPGDDVNLAIGQGDLLITPLQLANAYSTFLTRQLRAPVLLAGAEATPRGDIPLTDEQWSHLLLGLELVTSASGTASAAFVNAGYTGFGGKSGTAEDSGEQQHVLFVAFAPAEAPLAVAAVVLDDGESGSIEAGPMARDIVIAALP